MEKIKLNEKTVTREGTYTEYDTPHAILHFNYLYDSSEKYIEVKSTDIGKLPYQGVKVRAVTFNIVKTKQAKIGELVAEQFEMVDEDKLRGVHYVDAEVLDAKQIRKRLKGKLLENASFISGSETGYFVAMRNNGELMQLNAHDRVVTWKDDHYETIFTPPKAKPE